MKRRRLPGTELELSVVGLGCWAIGGKWWGDDVRDEDAIATVHAALEAGIDWVDTAPLYGHGHADEVLVRALGPRIREVTVVTKVGVRFDAERDHAESDLEPGFVRRDCEASLRRLGVQTIDLLMTHWPCERGTPLDDTIGALEALAREGKIRHWGLCNYGPEPLARAVDRGCAALQTPYSMIRRDYDHDGLRDIVVPEPGAAPRLGVLAYETLARGLLTGKHRSLPRFPQTDLRARDPRFWGPRFARASRFVELLRQAAERTGLPPSALATGWTLARPGVAGAIAGAKRPAQIRETARAAEVLDRPDVLRLLSRIAAAWRG